MTHFDIIRTLEGLWETDATAYDMACAVMQAADIESADLELEVESVIARALLAREFVDLSKVTAAVAKVLPGEAGKPLPLCEALIAEIDDARRTGHRQRAWMRIDDAQAITRKHFAALSVEEVADVLWPYFGASARINGEHKEAAQAVMRLLRKE